MRSRWTAGGDSCTAIYQKCGDASGKCRWGKERPVQAEEGTCRQIRMSTQERYAERRIVAKHTDRREKSRYRVYATPYRKTDTGG